MLCVSHTNTSSQLPSLAARVTMTSWWGNPTHPRRVFRFSFCMPLMLSLYPLSGVVADYAIAAIAAHRAAGIDVDLVVVNAENFSSCCFIAHAVSPSQRP